MGVTMHVFLLGRLGIAGQDGVKIHVRGPLLRSLLAHLLLRTPESVSRDQLIDAMWADRLPKDPINALHLQIAKLRRLLGDERNRLERVNGLGYRLLTYPGESDVDSFVRLSAESRNHLARHEWSRAGDAAQRALDLWRGPALADAGDHLIAATKRTWLDELRVLTFEYLAEARLAQGEQDVLIPVLPTLIATYPLRESLRALYMRTLYLMGRQAEALEVFHQTRSALRESLGVDPSPTLRALYGAVLDQDTFAVCAPPTLYASAGLPAAPAVPAVSGAAQAVPCESLPVCEEAPGRGTVRAACGAAAEPGSVPQQLKAFVGREREQESLRDAVRGRRLVTVTGPGGVGKTATALRSVQGLGPDFPGGLWHASLARLPIGAGPRDVADTLARTFGLGARDEVAGFLAGRHALLVLDDCEHVAEAVAATVESMARHCPDVSVLATSRQPLGVFDEVVIPLAPLPHPVAVDLFTSCAERQAPGRAWDEADLAATARLCSRLDNLPLAIELAAARTRMLTVPELEARIEDDLLLLGRPAVGEPGRHATLRAVFDRSHRLLTVAERRCLQALAPFEGVWSLEAAEHVCAGDLTPRETVAPVLSRLIDKSLVIPVRTAAGTRFRMLHTLRRYVLWRLHTAHDRQRVRRRHLEWARGADRSELELARLLGGGTGAAAGQL
jgi:predicted ATPase/DNA-binding SARP family transcriptional activator